MAGDWQIEAVAGAVAAALGYLLWKIFRRPGGGKGCGTCS